MSTSTTAALPPGKLGLPFLGETLPFIKDTFAFFDRRYREHGAVFKTRVLGSNVVCFAGADAARFFTDAEVFTRANSSPPHVRELLHPDAAPFLPEDKHGRRRRLMMHAFKPDAVASYQPTVERILRRHLTAWADGGREVVAVDALGLACFTLASALFIGTDPDQDDAEIASTFTRMSSGMLAPPINLPFTAYGKALKARNKLRTMIADAVANWKPGGPANVLARMHEAELPGGDKLSADEIRIETLHFLAAAHAGIQAALVNFLMAIVKFPEVAERARAAARGGDDTTLTHFTREVRRFYPIVPMTFFATVKKEASYGGYRIPAGWKAVLALHTTMHAASKFEQPDRFDPDRFARGEGAGDHAWVPHGPGDMNGHRCAGEALASQILLTFAQLALTDYSWGAPEQDLSWRLGGLAPLPKSGLRLNFRRAT